MSLKNLFYFCLFCFLFTACKGSKKLTDNRGKMNAEKARIALIQNQIRANWLDANVKLNVNGGGISQSASATVKIKKDSIIWVSVRKLGFEIARAQITKDSVYVLDRFNRQYLVNDLAFLSEEYNLPANLETLQAIFLGNPVFLSNAAMQLEEQENEYHLYSTGSQKGDYWMDKEDILLRRMQLQTASAQRLDIQLEDYQQLPDEQFFSYIRKLSIDSEETGEMKLGLEYQKVEINKPLSFRFEVPKNYTKIE